MPGLTQASSAASARAIRVERAMGPTTCGVVDAGLSWLFRDGENEVPGARHRVEVAPRWPGRH